MASVNKVILLGNLGRDPEARHTPDGGVICNLSVATSTNWKDRNTGERREETEWHRVVLYGRIAEVAELYLRKGRPVYIEGRIRTRKWQDKEGIERYTTEIIGDTLQMIGGRESDGDTVGFDSATPHSSSTPTNASVQSKSVSRPASPSAGHGEMNGMLEDDIPF